MSVSRRRGTRTKYQPKNESLILAAMSAKYTANEVADCILKFCNGHGDLITNLKLQKLLYYSQAWSLALHGKPLFDEDFQAWVHGPVEPVTYRRFKRFVFNPIAHSVKTDFDKHLSGYVKNVLEVYGKLSAFDLERQTNSEPPWKEARGELAPDQPSTEVITKQSMLGYYKSLGPKSKKERNGSDEEQTASVSRAARLHDQPAKEKRTRINMKKTKKAKKVPGCPTDRNDFNQCCCECAFHLQDFRHCTVDTEMREKLNKCICSIPKGWICDLPDELRESIVSRLYPESYVGRNQFMLVSSIIAHGVTPPWCKED